MSWNNLDQKFQYIFDKYSPKEKSSNEILKFYAEDLEGDDKQKYIDFILDKKAWILGTEICKISQSDVIIFNTEVKFALILENWISERLLHSDTLGTESKFPNLPKKFSTDFIEIFFSIRNLGFPEKLLNIIQNFFEKCNKYYLKKYFEDLFGILINDFLEEDIEKFFIYFSNQYNKTGYPNFNDFLYQFLNEFSSSYKIFNISNVFYGNLRRVSASLLDKVELGDNQYILISFLLSNFIQNKELDLNSPYYRNLITTQIVNLEKGSHENVTFFKFLKKFGFNFDIVDFELEIEAFFCNFLDSMSRYEEAQQTLKRAIAYHFLKSTDDYLDLFFFYLSNLNNRAKNIYYLTKFINIIDELRNQISSLFWIEEYLNFEVLEGSVYSQLNGGYLVKINETFFLKKLTDFNLEDTDEEFRKKNGYAFLNSKSLKESPEIEVVCNHLKLGKQHVSKEAFLFRISNINYSSSNKGAVINVVPDNERFRNDVIRYNFKSIFPLLELALIKKSNSLLDLENSFSSYYFKNLYSSNRKYNDIDFQIENDDFWKLLQEVRPVLYKNIFKENEKTKNLFKKIEAAFLSKDIIEGNVLARTNGGLFVDIWGFQGFLPGSQIDIKFVEDFDSFIGKTLQFLILKIDYDNKSVIVSSRAVLEPIIEKEKDDLRKRILRGSIHEGFVKNITSYGAFVDLGGVDGLIKISDISWGRNREINDVLKINQKIKVQVLDYNDEKSHIDLGLKQLHRNPWLNFPYEKFAVGTKIKGQVILVVDYGYFIELEEGIEGLLHNYELPNLRHPKEKLLKIGGHIETEIINLDIQNQKIALSLRYLDVNPWLTVSEKFKEGSIYRGIIENITHFGVFVKLDEGIVGLIHESDLAWLNFNQSPKIEIKVGNEIKVLIRRINIRERKIYLSQKLACEKFWNLIEYFMEIRTEMIGEITRINFDMVEVLLNNNIIAYYKLNRKRNYLTLRIRDKGIFTISDFNMNARTINVNFIRKLRNRINNSKS